MTQSHVEAFASSGTSPTASAATYPPGYPTPALPVEERASFTRPDRGAA